MGLSFNAGLSLSIGAGARETVQYPFTAFNFSVEIDVNGISPKLCNASFSDCDGLEVSMDVKTIREGGNNLSQIRLYGAANLGTLTLKRGMTGNYDLWDWMDAIYQASPEQRRGALRPDAYVVLLAEDRQTERGRWKLTRCMPIKIKAPAFSGKDGSIAIEEFQVAYESLSFEKPKGGG